MTIANPFAWALLLLAIPVILFFLLKVHFRKELITTSIFWKKVFEERRNRRLHRLLRYLLSLLIALLFLISLTAAVLDPALLTSQSGRCVIIIDNSARMNALLTEAGSTHLDIAKREAMKQLRQLSGRQVALLTANVEPKIITGFTDHSSTLRRKLMEISATDFPGDIPAALRLAEQLLADTPDAPIYIFSTVPEQPIDNIAITRFQPRRLPERATDYEIFIEVVNFGTETVETQIEIECDDNIVDVLPLSLKPNVPVTKIVRNTSASGGLFRATLASTDLFPTDNTASAFLSEQYVQQVLLYGQENFFLWHVLQALPLTDVRVIATIPETIPADSVFVIHQTVPPTLPSGNVLIIDPQNDCDLFQVGDSLTRPLATKVNTDNPLVRFISQGLVFVNARMLIPQNNNVSTLIETADNFPLYLQFAAGEQRVLVLSADLNQGDFSLRTAFPILISQALNHYRGIEELQKAYSTAEPVRLTLQTESTHVVVRSPLGSETTVPCRGGSVSLGGLGEIGVWTVIEPETQKKLALIACNLFSASVSNFRSASEDVQSSALSGAFFVRPIWFYLAVFALLLTAAEWWLYQRRWIE